MPLIEVCAQAYPEAQECVQLFRIEDKPLSDLVLHCEHLCKRAQTSYDIALLMKAFTTHTGAKNKEKVRNAVVEIEEHLNLVVSDHQDSAPKVLRTQIDAAKLFNAKSNN